MSSNLPKEVLKEIYDLQSEHECYQLDNELHIVKDNLEHFKNLSKLNITFYLFVFEEILTEPGLFDKLINLLDENNLTSAKISMSTNNKIKYGTHPLTNIAMWSRVQMRKNIETTDIFDGTNTVELIFSNKNFSLEKRNIKENRKYKSICSVRRRNKFRDYIFKNINLGNSICRYAEWDLGTNKDFTNFPTSSELIKEYHDSYISIVCETNNHLPRDGCLLSSDDMMKTPQFSEKSLIAFLSGTMPVIFGGANLIKNFNDIGLYTWNDYFGFKGDELYENHKIESFKQVVNKISNLSTDEVKKLWIENKDKIQSNVNIISDLMSYRIGQEVAIATSKILQYGKNLIAGEGEDSPTTLF